MAQSEAPDPDALKGTTLRVYRYLFKLGRPAGIHEVQRGLGLSSPSVAEYHLKKLLQTGLVNEGAEGYQVDRVMWGNMIRIRRTVVPLQAFYVVFFAGALVVMLLFVRTSLEDAVLFGLFVVAVALGLSAFALQKTVREF